MKRWLLIGAAGLLFAGCSDESFAERDPAGYEACSLYAEATANTSTVLKVGGLLEVGEQARRASTKAIRDSVTPLFDEEALELSGQENDFPLVDRGAIEDACADAGFEF